MDDDDDPPRDVFDERDVRNLHLWFDASERADPNPTRFTETGAPARATRTLYHDRIASRFRDEDTLMTAGLHALEEKLGPFHPDVAELCAELGRLHAADGNLARALYHDERAWRIYREKLHGARHPVTLAAQETLARTLNAAGNRARGEALMAAARDAREEEEREDGKREDGSAGRRTRDSIATTPPPPGDAPGKENANATTSLRPAAKASTASRAIAIGRARLADDIARAVTVTVAREEGGRGGRTDGRRDHDEVLKERRSPRQRGRMGTSHDRRTPVGARSSPEKPAWRGGGAATTRRRAEMSPDAAPRRRRVYREDYRKPTRAKESTTKPFLCGGVNQTRGSGRAHTPRNANPFAWYPGR
ncbi:uncharacterized protein MICPUCDRAFT_51284 [Micromonas pusilla CCMP1545]|uniref:Predicted protein n=1 Tax=Micromonas pusilla (strain CCMP1545) TaxID=564608 RepID=C1N170_MICPC|nr:uncharacterized protein MICPUCDRAFT_51284 [Micromonas pusilla CCMP1545]EEH54146.1 predicted protein [Micromonas pusilla CCMP1545]|eukprot:XP_003061516.1 predicted protein [Micromonas pusilla CCMP1545]